MKDEDDTQSAWDLLGTVRPFLCAELIEDDAFRQTIGLAVGRTIVLGGGEARFPREKFFKAIRRLYSDPDRRVRVADESGRRWELALEDRSSGPIINVRTGKKRLLIRGFFGLNVDRSSRLRDFALALHENGHSPEGLHDWREILEDRSLNDEEVNRLDIDLDGTPITESRKLARELDGPSGRIETIAPPTLTYYERLVGVGGADNIFDYAASVIAPLASNWLAWDIELGARMVLVLASHSEIVAASGLSELSKRVLGKLATWAIRDGDLVSKVGMFELGLMVLPRVPSLAGKVYKLAEQIRDLEPSNPADRLQLLSSAFILVDAELSRTQVLEGWPPFRRRLAALAQASLFERVSFGRLDVAHFSKWAVREYGHRFYMQNCVDLRLEPRWLPDLVSADQLKAELVGRVYHAARRWSDNIAEGPLRDLLFGEAPAGIAQHVQFPGSFLPGPIEGSADGQTIPIPPEFESVLDESLVSDSLRPESMIALINARGLFKISVEKVQRAVHLIRSAGHRFSVALDSEKRNNLIAGLAAVASTTRSVDLAADLRIMTRRVRLEGEEPLKPENELFFALTASAACSELDAWVDFAGDWLTELAFLAEVKESAAALETHLETLCLIEPALRRSTGRALAAVRSYART